MPKIIYTLLLTFSAVVFSACGGSDGSQVSSNGDANTPTQAPVINKQAITFPDLPNVGAPVADEIEVNN